MPRITNDDLHAVINRDPKVPQNKSDGIPPTRRQIARELLAARYQIQILQNETQRLKQALADERGEDS